MNSNLLSLISLGANKPQFKLDDNKKIPEEYLPSYVDDVIELLALASTEPSTCSKGDKYYNITSKKIFTATANNTWGSTGKNPEDGKIYLDTSTTPSTSYRWSSSEMIVIGQDLSNYVTLDSAQTITGAKTFSTLPVSNVTPTSDSQLSNKKYVDDEVTKRIMHYSTMPTASSENVEQIVQFIGTTTNDYTNGHFYKCVENSGVYSWENIEVQDGGGDVKVYVFTTPFTAVYTQSLSADDIVTLNKAIDSYRADEKFILFAKKMYFKINESTSIYSYNVPGVISGSGKNITITFYRNAQEANASVPVNFSSTAITRTITLSNVATPAAVSSASLSSQGTVTSTDNIITIGNTTSYNVSGDYNPAPKKYVDDAVSGRIAQYSTMPTASSSNEGKIVQFTGTTDSTYTNGYFYQCVSDGAVSPTYSWENIQVQGASSGSSYNIYDFGGYSGYGDTYTSGTQFELGKQIYDDIINKRYFVSKIDRLVYYCSESSWVAPRTFYYAYYDYSGSNIVLHYLHYTNSLGLPYQNGSFPSIFEAPITLNITNNELVSVRIEYADRNTFKFLPLNNWQEYNPSGNYNPATVKFVKDTATDIANKKTAMLNYDGGEHNKIYLNSANTLTPSLPGTAVESAYHGPNYTMEYTYTTAQSITPATRFSAHIVKILKTTYIGAQTISLTVSVVRNDTTLITKNFTGPSITNTNGTADVDTVDFDIPFDLELLEPLEIQVGDIFRVVVKCSSTYNYSYNGAIYSSPTNASYIEQYANGISAEDVYDTINGTTYSQHEINAMSGGDAPVYLITGTTQADVDKINECCNLFTQNKPFTAYYKSTAQYGPKYVPIVFFTMGTSDIFMNFIGWAGYSGNGQILVWGQIQGTGTPGQYSAIQIYDDPASYKEVLHEGYLQTFSNYSQYKTQTLKNNNGVFIWEDDSDVIAPKYSSSSTYAIGDYVMYQGKLYICSTAISQAEDWTAAHWTQTTVAGIIGNLNTVLASLTTPNNGGN